MSDKHQHRQELGQGLSSNADLGKRLWGMRLWSVVPGVVLENLLWCAEVATVFAERCFRATEVPNRVG